MDLFPQKMAARCCGLLLLEGTATLMISMLYQKKVFE